MDGYFVAPPPPVMMHAPHAPAGIPQGNSYQVNMSVIHNFWSVRDLWLEERWVSQSETASAALIAQVQPPAFTPHAPMVPVMFSW